MARLRRDDGFMMVELLMAITVMAIALTALVAVFSSGITSMGDSTGRTTATLLADAQMGTYQTMVYRDIGLDLGAATVAGLDSNYTSDSACANTATGETCAANGVQATETGPTGIVPNSCDTLDGWYLNTRPCDPSPLVTATSNPASPYCRSYRVDTYVYLAPGVHDGRSHANGVQGGDRRRARRPAARHRPRPRALRVRVRDRAGAGAAWIRAVPPDC